jgi:hypothetical protein
MENMCVLITVPNRRIHTSRTATWSVIIFIARLTKRHTIFFFFFIVFFCFFKGNVLLSNPAKNYFKKLNVLSIFDTSCMGDVPIEISLLEQNTHKTSNLPPLPEWKLCALPPDFQKSINFLTSAFYKVL